MIRTEWSHEFYEEKQRKYKPIGILISLRVTNTELYGTRNERYLQILLGSNNGFSKFHRSRVSFGLEIQSYIHTFSNISLQEE